MRDLSFWAWGYEDRFPTEEARRGLAAQVGAVLGVNLPTLLPLPTLDAARLPTARIDVPEALRGFASGSDEERVRHTYGRSYRDLVRAFQGDFVAAPDLVARPRDEEELGRVLEVCAKESLAAIPYGGGTSVVGGVEAPRDARFRGAVSIDLRAMDRVLEVDPVSRAARIQAGALGPVLDAQLAVHGFSLRHYPQSYEHSTLGGWLATRAGGHYATVYTHVDDLVESIRTLTPRGVLASRRLPASGAGPSPDRLVLGSEGTLGVITEAWMRVQARPRWRASASVGYPDLFAGARAARAIAQAALYPTNCRLLDPREALLNGVAEEPGAVLLLGFESSDHPVTAWMERALALAKEHGGSCSRGARYKDAGDRGGDDAAEAWRKAFLDAPYLQSALVSLGIIADTFETACTWDRFEALHAAVESSVTEALRRVAGGGSLSCRFTHVYPDGPAPYFTFVAPGRPGAELEQWAEIKRAASDALLANGATITHHHAVGRLHRPWYDRQRPDLFAESLRATKRTLDPSGVMNPGVLI